MKNHITLLGLIIFTTQLANTKISEDFATYKNLNGYEIKHKPCQKIEARYSYEPDNEDLSKLDSIAIDSTCGTKVKKSISIGPHSEEFKDSTEMDKYFENKRILSLKDRKRSKSNIVYIPEKKYLKDNSLLYLSIMKRSKLGHYRWSIQKQCGNIYFAIEINVKNLTPDESKSLEAKINSGEEIIPIEEKKIIDSFKCTR